MPMNLRHPTLINVLEALTRTAQVSFSAPEAGYADRKIPHFANIGDGFQALAAAGRAFEIEDFFWQQEPNGSVFVGSWQVSKWTDKVIELPANFFNEIYGNAATLPAIPSIAPGVVINGKRVTKVEFNRVSMTLTWEKR